MYLAQHGQSVHRDACADIVSCFNVFTCLAQQTNLSCISVLQLAQIAQPRPPTLSFTAHLPKPISA